MADRTDAFGASPAPAPALGELIRRRRRALGLTQTQLARLFSVDQSRVSRWETGERVDAKKLIMLADWLDISVDDAVRLNFEWMAPDEPMAGEFTPTPTIEPASSSELDDDDGRYPVVTIVLMEPSKAAEHLVAAATLGLGVEISNQVWVDTGDDLLHTVWVVSLYPSPAE